jgi:uncharacterized membrane protein YfcA
LEFFTHYLFEIMEEITLKSLMISLIMVFIGGLIQGYTGFGGGTISVPILVLLFGPIAAIGIITPIYIFGALAILPKAIKNVNWSEVLPVSIAGSIAVFVGLSILVNTNPLVIKNIMGFFILLTTLIMIAGRKYNGPRNIFTSIITGLLTGGVSGGTGIPGAPIMVIYYLAAKTTPTIQRANILITGCIFSFCIIIGLAQNSIYDHSIILIILILSPIFMIAAKLGQYLFKLVPAEWFKNVAYSLLILAGSMLLIY